MVSLKITWTPVSVPVSFTVGGNAYPYNSLHGQAPTAEHIARYGSFTTPINTLITFTAQIISPLLIVAHKWNFGDGKIGYGPTVAHTFKFSTPQQQVYLTVTDSSAREFYTSAQLNLRPAEPFQIGSGFQV